MSHDAEADHAEPDLAVADPAEPDLDDPGLVQPDLDDWDLDDDAPGGTGRRPPARTADRSLVLAGGIAAGLALLSVVLLVLLVHERSQAKTARSEAAERTTVETTASRVAEALVTVDASGNQRGAQVVRELGTGPLIQQFDEANNTVRKTFGPLKIQSISGEVKEVYVKDVEAAQADVIVVLNLVIVGDNPRVDQNHYLRVHLAKLDGVWKVDDVQDVNLALAGGNGGANGAPAPATTAPPPAASGSSSSSP